MKKKLLVLIFSAFMAILLCGCSDVSYTFMTKYDGSIVEEYCFAVNYAELGTGRAAVETEINEKLTVLKTNYTNDFVNKVEASTLTQEEKNSYIEGYNCYAEKAEETQNVFTYYFGFEFANRAVYEFAWGIEEDEEESEEDNGLIFEYNFLTYNIIQKTKTKFGKRMPYILIGMLGSLIIFPFIALMFIWNSFVGVVI
ncbi:MAG: hypothetical protein IKA31_01660, partial [Clostridia bacterium]|nr:hypothetical protein [Clostridia bacterium]